jgi:hypothetical protein
LLLLLLLGHWHGHLRGDVGVAAWHGHVSAAHIELVAAVVGLLLLPVVILALARWLLLLMLLLLLLLILRLLMLRLLMLRLVVVLVVLLMLLMLLLGRSEGHLAARVLAAALRWSSMSLVAPVATTSLVMHHLRLVLLPHGWRLLLAIVERLLALLQHIWLESGGLRLHSCILLNGVERHRIRNLLNHRLLPNRL